MGTTDWVKAMKRELLELLDIQKYKLFGGVQHLTWPHIY